MDGKMRRRDFLRSTAAAAAGLGLARHARGEFNEEGLRAEGMPEPRADSMILIWLPGGVAQTDTWDPKKYTPFEPGMRGNEVLGTCPLIPTAADGIEFGEGLEHMASVMDKGAILRTLTNDTSFGAVHLRAQHFVKTGYMFPAGFKAPSMGSIVARTLGRRHPHIPAYIDIGRDISTSNEEFLFINEFMGPGFLPVEYGPFMIPHPSEGLDTLEAYAGLDGDRLDRRQRLMGDLSRMAPEALRDNPRARDYLTMMDDARAMMDSPVKEAFAFRNDEKPEVLAKYDSGHRFGWGCLLARRLVEEGARFVEVEYQFEPFGGFDMHDFGQPRMVDMKKQIDGPIGQLIQDLDERGLLERTLVVIMTEFGRTIADQPAAGVEPLGFTETSTGEDLVIADKSMYGFHGHFSSCNSVLFFGGGFKGGYVYGKTAPEHPMRAIENPVTLQDVHATIYTALGIAPDVYYMTEGRPVYVTQDGRGEAITDLYA